MDIRERRTSPWNPRHHLITFLERPAGWPTRQADALLRVIDAVTAADLVRASRLADRAEALARSISDASPVSISYHDDALAQVAEAVAGTDPDRADRLVDRAEALVRAVSDRIFTQTRSRSVVFHPGAHLRSSSWQPASWANSVSGEHDHATPSGQWPQDGEAPLGISQSGPSFVRDGHLRPSAALGALSVNGAGWRHSP